MIYIYLLLMVLNTSSAYAIYFNKKIEETIFPSIALTILLLFLSGVFLNLAIGFYAILLLNIPLLVYNIYSIRKNSKKFKSNLFTPGLFIFIITYLVFIWINHGRMVTIWDEFSHWALVVKNMFYLDNFGLGSDSTVLAKNYLSGTSIFQYFCMKLNGSFNESIMYLGMNILSFSLLLPIFKVYKNIKHLSMYIIWFIILSFPTLLYNTFYSSLYVDAILGLTFAYSLYSYYFNYEEGLTKFNTINFALALAMMIFIKDMGMVFAFIAFAIVLIDNLFIRNKFVLDFYSILKNGRNVLLSVIPCIFVKIIWLITLDVYSVGSSLSAGGGLISNLLGLFSLNHDGYKYGVVYNFVNALFSYKLFGTDISISFILLVGFFIFLMYLLITKLTKKDLQRSYTILTSTVVIGSMGYVLLLLLSYLSVFSQYEALNLMSYHRYISTCALGLIALLIVLYIKKYSDSSKELLKVAMMSFALMLLFVDFPSLINSTVFARDSVSVTKNTRSAYQQIKSTIEENVDKNDRVYFISTDDNGIDFYISRYEMTPVQVNLKYAWSIGDKYNDADIWTVQKSPTEWYQELIKDYDYVYLFDIDDQFIAKYSSLFSVSSNQIADNQLYKVNKALNNTKILELSN